MVSGDLEHFDFRTEDDLPQQQSPGMRACPHCRQPIPEDSLFCLYCSEPVAPVTAKSRVWVFAVAILVLFAFLLLILRR